MYKYPKLNSEILLVLLIYIFFNNCLATEQSILQLIATPISV
jgi:hypothetical protein